MASSLCPSYCHISHEMKNGAVLFPGAFQLAEVDLAALLPEEALVPFAEELQGRDRRRERRVKVTSPQHQSNQSVMLQNRLCASCLIRHINTCFIHKISCRFQQYLCPCIAQEEAQQAARDAKQAAARAAALAASSAGPSAAELKVTFTSDQSCLVVLLDC